MKDTPSTSRAGEGKRTSARGIVASLLVAAAFGAAGAVPAVADIEPLPSAACNDGTRNAHQSVPHTNPAQGTNPGHKHLPRAPGGICVHTTNP